MSDEARSRHVETPSPDVRALLTGHDRRDASWCWRPRGTPTALLVHTRAGRAAVRVGAGEAEQEISAGDTVLWAPGVPHDFGCRPGAQTWELVWVHFRPRDDWPDWLTWPTLRAGVAVIPAPPERLRQRIETALLDMDGFARSALPRGTDLAANALERALLWLDAASAGPHEQLDDRVREAVLFIARHLDDALDVESIAAAVHLSPSRLSHLFTRELGTPPGRFVEQRRMERAQALLESSSLPIRAIADATGFSSPYYFATRFKALTGRTPGDWRRQARAPVVSTNGPGPARG